MKVYASKKKGGIRMNLAQEIPQNLIHQAEGIGFRLSFNSGLVVTAVRALGILSTRRDIGSRRERNQCRTPRLVQC